MITNNNTLGIYIHIPFCYRKCRYCDFLSFTECSEDLVSQYTEKLCTEIISKSDLQIKSSIVDSIFIGGGTPSFINEKNIDDILDALYARYNIDDNAEVTLEANPGTATEQKLRAYKNSGINRLSFGVQTFDEKQLKLLGRIHDSKDAIDTYKKARNAGFENINLDLMFGLPDETLEIWRNDLETAISLDPEHLSFYSLTIEEDTPIFHDVMNGRATELDEVTDRLMYHNAIELLKEKRYNHYEISNASKEGFESRHNLKYWTMKNYLGLGLGSHSYVDGVRFANTENMHEYLSNDHPVEMIHWIHENTISDEISEYVFLGLRKTAGINLDEFKDQFGKSFWDVYEVETNQLIDRGLLERNDDMLRLTPLGLDLSNQVFMEYV